MKGLRSGILCLAVAGGMVLAASPASAWVCTAKNARGATYSAIGVLYNNTVNRALNKCWSDTVVKASCHIVSCVP